MRKKRNVFILLGAAAVGAVSVNFWDTSVQRLQLKLVEKALAANKITPAADIHSLGFHGQWADIHMDEDPPYSPAQQKLIAEADAKARPIFATPGGAYTKEDIALNGTTPPYERFHRFQFLAIMKPYPAQPFDPITHTKTGGAFAWYVGGKLYHFASIGSLEAFVVMAKTQPGPLPAPEAFIVPGKPVEG
jgi:hypothetical protein